MGFSDMGFDDFDSSGGFSGDDPFSDFNPSGGSNTNSGFDDFSGFGGNQGGQGFGGNQGFGNAQGFDDSFADMNPSSPNGMSSNNGQVDPDRNQFENMFSDQNNIGADDDNSKENLKKTAIVFAIIGVIIIIVVIIGASFIGKKNKTKEEVTDSGVTIIEQPQQQIQVQQQPTQQQVPANVDAIMQSGNEPESSTTVNVPKKSSAWTVIDSEQKIEFNSEYKELMFYITGIEHRAKMEGNSIIVKTVLTGSLSGMSGTYEMDIPYSKGSQLREGQEFKVSVLLGSFNGKTVVGDIKY